MEKQKQYEDIVLNFSRAVGRRKKSPDSGDLLRMEGSISSVQEFEDLLKKWDRQTLLKVVSCFVRDDPEAAEDIVQHSTLRAYRSLNGGGPYIVPREMLEHLKTVDSESQDLDLNQRDVKVTNPSAWMYTILRNTARNYYRSKKRSEKKLKALMREAERLGSGIEHPEATAVRNIGNEELRRYVRALPQPYSRIIAEYYLEEMKLKDIAKELGYSYSTVRQYARRGLQMLKEMILGERGIEDGKMVRYGRKRPASSPPSADFLA